VGIKILLSTMLCALTLGFSTARAADDVNVVIDPPAEGSVSADEGLAAWQRIFEVTSHPRCANCHVGDSPFPMWSGPSYGKTRRHGMNINAGNSRIGAEFLLCSSCHTTSLSKQANNVEGHDVILHWAWAPGGNREPAPYSLQEHVDDLLMWGAAGAPCPEPGS